ncbi:MAG TPA: P-II family nitrogen regulator [Pirellulaceae bacterium]|nr:P-II family nitrogen regulator [Pirellulaceae bacterium]
MRLIIAMIRPTKLRAVQEALEKIGVERITLCDAQGYGRQRGRTESYRGVEYQVNLLRKVLLEIAVNDDFVEPTIETLQRIARTGTDGEFGDGKVMVLPLVDAIEIGGSQRGKGAI